MAATYHDENKQSDWETTLERGNNWTEEQAIARGQRRQSRQLTQSPWGGRELDSFDENRNSVWLGFTACEETWDERETEESAQGGV